MSSGPLPPVPDLIPISAFRKASPSNDNSNGGLQESAPCVCFRSEVMGEQRPRRRSANQPAVELIDSAGSRGASAAPQKPHTRKVRSERHRKSDRRRDHRKHTRTRSNSKHSKSREEFSCSTTSPKFPSNPRVNPIFVWVRQEDNRIVDVKCEDYDKRNRILLTKTAQGWRAIPRTETLVPSLKEAAAKGQNSHHHHKSKKSRKGKVRRRSTGVQVSSDLEQEETEQVEEEPEQQEQQEAEANKIQDEQTVDKQIPNSPSWMSTDNVNIESLLPSHTIQVKRSTSPRRSPERDSNVNSAVSDCAQTPSLKCSADKICDVSPLDNLLAVAELEFNQQIQSGEWNKTNQSEIVEHNEDAAVSYEKSFDETDDDKEFMKNLEQLNELIECEEGKLGIDADFESDQHKTEECDYTEDDDNNLAMDDILSRLEQSLRSPECTEINNCDSSFEAKHEVEELNEYASDNENNLKSVPDLEDYFKVTDDPDPEEIKEDFELSKKTPEVTNLVESSTTDSEEPTDLTVKMNESSVTGNNCDVTDEPTDLSIPKIIASPRPHSQNSEAIQSPQPSGIPAVPPSPDIVSTTVSGKPKSMFLESLLTSNSKKIALNSEVTIIRQREPLDLGNNRKSASPTVSCSEEANSSAPDAEPPLKKIKSMDITLKNLLDVDLTKSNAEPKSSEKTFAAETPRLLELLKNDTELDLLETDPLTQLKQLLSDTSMDIPDPMLVPKDQFSSILSRPGTEIPKLLKERPELRLPEALAYPHIMQDPNMLVLNIHHLESILSNKSTQDSNEILKTAAAEKTPKTSKKTETTPYDTILEPSKKKPSDNAMKTKVSSESQTKNFSELANDIDAATQAAFSQMAWLPYLNHLEAMSLTNNSDFMKMLTNSMNPFPMYFNQMPDFSQILGGSRMQVPPMGFPVQQTPMNYGNPWEMSMWQEAMMQANLLRNNNFGSEQVFKNNMEKISHQHKKSSTNSAHQRNHSTSKHQGHHNHFYKNDHPGAYQNPYMTAYQGNAAKSGLQQSQFGGGIIHQKNLMGQRQQQAASFMQKPMNNFQHQKQDHNQNFTSLFTQQVEADHHQYLQNLNMTNHQEQFHLGNAQRKEPSSAAQKPKLACRSFANLSHKKSDKSHSSGGDSSSKQQTTTQPIDLSGATSGSKLKVKQHLVDPTNTPKLLKQHDDIPEVGSTTASIEEMQDAHKHLWHPLFGNQKNYTSPWNWTTVTATGE